MPVAVGSSTWTDDRIAAMTAHFYQGLSASQSAKLLGGVTRNAVIGRRFRMGLVLTPEQRSAAMATGANRQPARRTTPKGLPLYPREPKPRLVAPARPPESRDPRWTPPRASTALPATAVTFSDREPHQCVWCVEPFEAPAHEFMMVCGARVAEAGRPYCEAHEARSRGVPIEHRIIKPPFEKTVISVAA
jgi:GcrA cell cycle regulator